MNRIFTIIFVITLLVAPNSWAAQWEGEGTTASPYLLQSANDLLLLAQSVDEKNNYEGVCFKLVADIDLSSVCGEAKGDWPSIGSIDYHFQGAFDGGGYKIKQLSIAMRGNTYRGLFGYIGDKGRVENLFVEGDIYSSFWAGMIAGASSGVISNCLSEGRVEAYQYAGGIVGGNFGTVLQCQNRAQITSALATGGICGYNYGKLHNSGNLGDIYGYTGAGGVVGYNGGFSSFTNCYNTPMGIIQNCGNEAYVSGRTKVGGVVGRNDGLLFNAFNSGELSANSEAGGIAGYNGGFDGVDGHIYNCYNVGDISSSIAQAGGIVGVNNTVGDLFNVYNAGEVLSPGERGTLVATNAGNVRYGYLLGQEGEWASENDGILSDCKAFAKTESLPLEALLNQWVEESGDSIFAHWRVDANNNYPTLADIKLPVYNVTIYNFHGVIKENWFYFSEGQEVHFSVVPDAGYDLIGATALCNGDTIKVSQEELNLSFVMPRGDVILHLQWQQDTSASNVLAQTKLRTLGRKGEMLFFAEANVEVAIYNLNGKMIRRFPMQTNEYRTISLPTGVYLVNGEEVLVW